MDFMNDSFENHCQFRTFNVIDDFSRERLYIDIAISLSAGRIITRYLERLAQYQDYPLKIRVDNGTEFTANRFTSSAKSYKK